MHNAILNDLEVYNKNLEGQGKEKKLHAAVSNIINLWHYCHPRIGNTLSASIIIKKGMCK